MLKDIKMGFKLLKYGYKIKLNICMLLLFTIIGIVTEVTSKGTSIIGGFYFMITGMFVYQMIMSVDVSEYIQTSPMKRKLQIAIPVITSTVFYLLIFTFLVIERIILINSMPGNAQLLMISLFQIELFMLITFVFSSICYKYFVFGFLLFLILDFGVVISSSLFISTSIAEKFFSMPIGFFAALGYAVIFFGAFLEVMLGKILYKKPLSLFAFKGIFKD